MKFKLFLSAILIVHFFNVNSQVVVNQNAPYDDVQYLVNDVLLGNGVTASQITSTGDASQIGYFSGGAGIGINEGIIMSTGNAADAVPGSGGDDDFATTTSNPELVAIAQSVTTNPNAGLINSTEDEASIEFFFNVTGDSIEFQFVFASNEYDAWVNSQYNDVFAFFLSGPGITGPYNSPMPGGALNVAVVPGASVSQTITDIQNGTGLPISISSIHAGLNSQYYINNATNVGQNSFNAFTTVFTVKFPVECGGRYHFRLAIADCQDGTLASGVFLGARSLGSEGISVNQFSPWNGIVGEECGEAGFVITRSDTTTSESFIFETSGDATPGVDYNWSSNSSINDTTIVLGVGQSSDTIFIDALQDNTQEPLEFVTVRLKDIEGCVMDTIWIQSIEPMVGRMTVDSANVCPPDSVRIGVTLEGGIAPYSYNWNYAPENDDTVYVAPLATTQFTVNTTDVCGNTLSIDGTTVWVQCPMEPTNVFTPNGDGSNDFFSVINLDDYPNATLVVFNRWGTKVFEQDNYQNDWKGTNKAGKDLGEGVYYYVVTPNSKKYEYTDHEKEEVKRTLTGFVHLMR